MKFRLNVFVKINMILALSLPETCRAFLQKQ